MTEKHKWISDNLSLIEETTGIKLYGTVCTDITFIAKQLNDANETILRLEKENEQLKSELQDKRLGINLFNAENTLLMEENEHIKQTIKDMMENERTELGRSVLNQLWEAIQ